MSDLESEGKRKRKSGIPTGNAGEYLVMGELLRRGFDAQLADRNTKGYDLTAASNGSTELKRVQVKTVRTQPWYVRRSSFEGSPQDQVTIYVLLGPENSTKPARFFIARNRDLAKKVHYPPKWADSPDWSGQGFMPLKEVMDYENKWDNVCC